MGNLIIGGDKIIKPIMSILPAIRWNILFSDIVIGFIAVPLKSKRVL